MYLRHPQIRAVGGEDTALDCAAVGGPRVWRMKRALYTLKRAQYILKRALYILKRVFICVIGVTGMCDMTHWHVQYDIPAEWMSREVGPLLVVQVRIICTRHFPQKSAYNYWLFCGKRPATYKVSYLFSPPTFWTALVCAAVGGPCVVWKEPYILWEEPNMFWKETYIFWKELYIL